MRLTNLYNGTKTINCFDNHSLPVVYTLVCSK